MAKTKFDTEVAFIFVRGNGTTDWAVIENMNDEVHIVVHNENPNARSFCSEAKHLKEWCESHGYDYHVERLDYTFSVEFKRSRFSEVQVGEQFTRIDCNQKFIRVKYMKADSVEFNAICLEGSHAGMRYLVQNDEMVKA